MSVIALVFLLIALLMVISAFFPAWNFSAGPVVTPNRIIGLVIGLVVLFVVYLIVVALFGSAGTLHASAVSPLALMGAGFLVGAVSPVPASSPVLESDPTVPKAWLESRTIIFNGLVAVLTIAYAIAQILTQNPTGLDPRIISAAGIIVAVGNIYLRAGTNQPIAGTKAAAQVEQALIAKSLVAPTAGQVPVPRGTLDTI